MKHTKPIVLHVISSLKIGGAEKVLCDLVRTLKDEYENHVAYFHDGPLIELLHKSGIRTHCIKSNFCQYNPILIFKLFFYVRRVRPDIIHSSLWLANTASVIVGKVLKVPTILTWHNNLDQNGFFRNMLSRITSRLASCIVSVSDEVDCGARKILRFVPQEKFEVVKNGVDVEQLHKESQEKKIQRKDVGLSEDHFVLGSVGRFEIVKNYSFMILAFADLVKKNPRIRLVLVGVGTQEHKLRGLAKSCGIGEKVLFVVGKPSSSYFPLFDCFTLTSTKEGISIALLEAMSFGLVSVVTNSVTTHDVISNGENGIIVLAEDKRSYVCAVESVIESEALRAKIGRQAQKTIINNFCLGSMVREYKKIYNKVLDDKKLCCM
ncbi:glycosyltransferase [bacterium]|jgi:glycosyltransferase involved in cell wall biosynthesis|nr:glycosyltransferase [bacterium]